MQITKEQAVELFTAMGFQTATNWDKEKMNKKLLKLSELAQDNPDLGSEELNDFLDELLSSGKTVTVAESGESVTQVKEDIEAEAEEKASKKSSKKKKVEKAVKEKKEKPKEKLTKVKKEKVEKKKAEKKTTRVGLAARFIMSCTSPTAIKELAAGSDALFATSGGIANEKEAVYAVRVALQVLEALELVTDENGAVTVKK